MGTREGYAKSRAAALCMVSLVVATMPPAHAQTPVRIVALGDSLTAGLGLPVNDGFVPRLQAALAAKGIAAEIVNAGVSGDTASGGLARLDWSVPNATDAVIVELGANDMLRGMQPQVTREALDALLRRLSERHIAVLLCGMRAAPNLGADYGQAFRSHLSASSRSNTAHCSIRSFSTASPAISTCCSPMVCIPPRPAWRSWSREFCQRCSELIARVARVHIPDPEGCAPQAIPAC